MKKVKKVQGRYGEFLIIYQKEDFVVCKSPRKNQYFIGNERDMYSLYSFGVNDSCLTKNECIKRLKQHKKLNAESYERCKDIYVNKLKISKKEFLSMYNEPLKILEGK